MALFNIKNEQVLFEVRHRIICEKDGEKGPWRDTETECYEDAKKHRAKPGNKFHVMRIITEQKMSRELEIIE